MCILQKCCHSNFLAPRKREFEKIEICEILSSLLNQSYLEKLIASPKVKKRNI